jgi:hypothetical protein
MLESLEEQTEIPVVTPKKGVLAAQKVGSEVKDCGTVNR